MATDQTDTTWKFTFQDLDQWARENFPTEYAALPDVSTIRFSNHSNSINSRGILSTRIYVGHRSANDKTGIHGYWDTVNSRSLFRTGREQRYRKHLYAYTVKELCKPFSDIPGVIVNSRYNAPLKSYEPIGCLVTYYFLAKGLVTSISTGSLDLQMFQWACRTVANGEPAPEIVRQEGVIKQLEHIVRTRAASEAQLVPQSPVKSQQTAVNVPANSSTIAQPVRTDPHEGTTQNSGQTAQSDTDSATQNSQPTLSVTGSTTETGAQNRRHATPSVAESATNTQGE